MTPSYWSYFTLLLSLVSVVPVSSLMCYSCQSSRPFSECESDVRELRKGVHSKFAVNCSDYNNLFPNYCAIESYIQNGEINAMIRDCNSGNFSFTMDNYPFLKMKHVNGLSNISVCTYSRGRVTCASLCDTDMCNGPLNAVWGYKPPNWKLISLYYIFCLVVFT